MGNPAEENDRMPDALTITNGGLRRQDLFIPIYTEGPPGNYPGRTDWEVSDIPTKLQYGYFGKSSG